MRKTIEVVIAPDDKANRDRGKRFVITEMSAMQAERWASRALSLMAKSGVEVPPETLAGGWAAVVVVGIRAVAASLGEADDLRNEMMACVKIVSPVPPSPRALVPDVDIEEVSTLLKLRQEVLELHSNFGWLADFLKSVGAMMAMDLPTQATSTSPLMQ